MRKIKLIFKKLKSHVSPGWTNQSALLLFNETRVIFSNVETCGMFWDLSWLDGSTFFLLTLNLSIIQGTLIIKWLVHDRYSPRIGLHPNDGEQSISRAIERIRWICLDSYSRVGLIHAHQPSFTDGADRWRWRPFKEDGRKSVTLCAFSLLATCFWLVYRFSCFHRPRPLWVSLTTPITRRFSFSAFRRRRVSAWFLINWKRQLRTDQYARVAQSTSYDVNFGASKTSSPLADRITGTNFFISDTKETRGGCYV